MRRFSWVRGISWIDRAKSEVLYGVDEERNILYSVKGRRDNWIGHIFRRNFLLTCVIDGKTEKWQWREKKSKRLSNYCVTLGKRDDARNWEKIYCVALSVEIALEEAMDLLQDRLHGYNCYSVGLLGFCIAQCLWLEFSEERDAFVSIMNDLVQVYDSASNVS